MTKEDKKQMEMLKEEIIKRKFLNEYEEVNLWHFIWGCLSTILFFWSFISESLIKFVGAIFFIVLVYLTKE